MKMRNNRMNSMKYASLCTTLIVLSGLAPMAMTDDEKMENIVVTGTRLDATVEAMPGHVTVVDRALIEDRNDASVLDLLRSVSGVHVTQLGGRGGISSVHIRGAEPNFTIVLIDGVKVNDPNNTDGGSFDFSTLNISQIERIEIARGPQSSVYGSDGLSGIISITTRNAASSGMVVSAEAGADSLLRASLHGSGSIGESSRLTVGISADDDGTPVEGSQFKNTSASAQLSSDLRDDVSLMFEARYADSEAKSFPEDSGGPRLSTLRSLEQRDQTQFTFGATIGYDVSTATHLNFHAGYAELDALVRNPGIAPGVRDGVPTSFTDATIKRKNLTANVVFELSDAMQATTGIDYQDEDGDSVGSVEFFPGFSLPQDFALDRDIFGVFAEMRLDATEDLSFTASVRHDDPSGDSSETTSRVGLQYLTEGARLFASWGQAFKLPSFFALGNALVGNPDLRPETSDNWEIGASYGDAGLSVTLSAFRNDFEDLIDFDSATFKMVNRDDVRIQGVELASDLEVSEALSLSAHLTHTDIDIKNATENLLQRPDWRGGISARWQASPDIRLNIDWLYVGDSFDSSVPTGEITLGGYNRVDVVGSWSPSDPFTVWLAVDNVFDKGYEEAVGFPGVGVRARLGFRYAL